MKKGWIIVLVVVLLIGLGGYIWYSRLKNNAAAEGGPYDNTLKPRLELAKMAITDIREESIRMNMYLLIDNPLPVGFKSPQMDYTVYIADTPVVKDTYRKAISVEAGDSTLIMLPVTVLTDKMTNVLKTLERKGIDSTTYKVQSTFELDVPIVGEKTFVVTIERRMPTFYIPKIKIEDIDFGPLGLKRTDVATKVLVTNKNKLPFNITDAKYTVTIDGKVIADGKQPDPILIKAQATTPVIFPVTARPGKTLSVLPKMLFDKKDTPYVVDFQCKLIDKEKNPMIQQSKFVAKITGTLDDFKKLKK
ncbi:LEA type 2 family protein [Spirosoma sp. BT702]|uniref:LEA type 2 family protein n=1 Tax=Spirosoma profusum TaxID=2771354 RepID=A0A926Y005_9BACT|nr:LEA type 2 family protein [Spirosoma profusum]MBD2699276.1 LEA type 2 family protein [Spirosoma profusum]